MNIFISKIVLPLSLIFGSVGAVIAQPQDENLRDCVGWCNLVGGCVACSTLNDCGAGYDKTGQTFNQSGAKPWHACKARNHKRFGRRSEGKRSACMNYCSNNYLRCDMCSTYKNCGPNYSRMSSYTGKGRDWFACEDNTLNRFDNAMQENIPHGTISSPWWGRH